MVSSHFIIFCIMILICSLFNVLHPGVSKVKGLTDIQKLQSGAKSHID